MLKNPLAKQAMLFIALVIVLAFQGLRYWGLSISHAQIALFPIVAILLALLALAIKYRPLLLLVCVSTIGWIFSTSNLLAVLPSAIQSGDLFFAKYEDSHDPEGIESWHRYRLYSKYARAYPFPDAHILDREFKNNDAAAIWLNSKNGKALLLRGDKNWPSVVFKQKSTDYFRSYKFDNKRYAELATRAEALKLDLNDEAVVIPWLEGEQEFLLQIAPEVITVPSAPEQLTLPLIGWLAHGLSLNLSLKENEADNAVLESIRRDAFNEAASIVGFWKSLTGIAAAEFFRATHDSYVALSWNGNADQSGWGETTLDCALKSLRTAAGRVIKKNDPEIFAAIYNNAAISLLYKNPTPEDILTIKSWLTKASKTKDRDGHVVRGAKLALLNLVALDKLAFN
jgi:hypothetical protein